MRSRPEIFISATTRDLGGCRQLIKEAVLSMGGAPVEQRNFPSSGEASVHAANNARIADCQAMIHVIGICYGQEPSGQDGRQHRLSYTQLEYEEALTLGIPAYVYVCNEGFMFDKHEPEELEKRNLQESYRARILTGDYPYKVVASREELERDVFGLQLRVGQLANELEGVDDRLRGGIRRLERVLVALLVVATAIALLPLRNEHGPEKELLLAQAIVQVLSDPDLGFDDQSILESLEALMVERGEDPGRAQELLEAMHESDTEAGPLAVAGIKLLLSDFEGTLDVIDDRKEEARAWAWIETAAAWAGYYEQSRPNLLTRALASAQRLILLTDQEQHPMEWADAAVALSRLLQESGRHGEALPLLRDVLPVLEHHRGPNHLAVASCLNGLAIALNHTGHEVDAISPMRRALRIVEGRSGPIDSRTVFALVNLSSLLRKIGRGAEARPYLRRALEVAEQLTSDNALAAVYYQLGQFDQEAGQFADAEEWLRQALRHSKNLGFRAEVMQSLAWVMLDAGRPEESEVVVRECLVLCEKVFGGEATLVGRNLALLGGCLREMGEFEKAADALRRSRDIAYELYGACDKRVTSLLSDLGSVYFEMGKWPDAIAALEGAVNSERCHVATDPQELSRVLVLLGRAHAGAQHWRDAEFALNEAAVIMEEHALTGAQLFEALDELRWVMAQDGRSEEAVNRLRLTLERLDARDSDPGNIASALDALANALVDNEDYAGAEPILTRAVSIREDLSGEDLPLARTVFNLAGVLAVLGRFESAEVRMRRALEIGEAHFGPDDPGLSDPLLLLAEICDQLDQADDARELRARAATLAADGED